VFWDASALVPCLIEETRSTQINKLFVDDVDIVIWWATPVECASALERKRREGLPAAQYTEGYKRLLGTLRVASQILPSEILRGVALNCLVHYRLRASDAFQLAAAKAFDRVSLPVEFVCMDNFLRDAAIAEGFICVP
jgi:hypothetical protein